MAAETTPPLDELACGGKFATLAPGPDQPLTDAALRDHLKSINSFLSEASAVKEAGKETAELIARAPDGSTFAKQLYIALTEKPMHYVRQNFFYEALLNNALEASRRYLLSESDQALINRGLHESMKQDKLRTLDPFTHLLWGGSVHPESDAALRNHLKGIHHFLPEISAVKEAGKGTAELIAKAPDGPTFARLLYIALTEKPMYYERQNYFYESLLKDALLASRNYRLSEADQALIQKGLRESMKQDKLRTLDNFTHPLWGGSDNPAADAAIREHLNGIQPFEKVPATLREAGKSTAELIAQAPSGAVFARQLYIALTEKSIYYVGQNYFYEGLLSHALKASRNFKFTEAEQALIYKGLAESMKQDKNRTLDEFTHFYWGQ